MAKSKPLLPTVTSALGMLLGGLLGAGGGALAGNELVVIACYVTGFLGGAIAGALFGWRWLARQNPEAPHAD